MLVFIMVTPVMANDGGGEPEPPSEPTLSDLWEEIRRLDRENAELRQQLREQEQAPPQTPNPQLVTPQNITVNAGETVEIEVLIRNLGTGIAHNFLSQAAASAGAPFVAEFLGNSNSTNQLRQNGTQTMRLQMAVDAGAETGNHEIVLTNHFRNPDNTNRTTSNTINVRVIGAATTAPNVRLSNFQVGAAVSPGQAFNISANISNPGNIPAQDVQVSFASLDPNIIFFTGDLNQAFFANMAGGASHTLNFPMQASVNAPSGTHQINFRVTFRGATGAPITETFPAFVTIAGTDDGISSLEIRNLTSPSSTINVGQNATVTFYVHNAGTAEARNIRVEATPEVATVIVPVQTSRTQIIPSIAPGESHRLTFSFSPLDSAQTRSYGIGFTVTHGEYSTQQFAVINVNNPETDDDTPGGRVQIPRVIVASAELDPPMPRAGQEFTMNITFRNTSATRSVNNVRIVMEEVFGTALPGQQGHFAGFNPVGGSSTLFIDDIAPHGEVEMSLRFTSVTEATPGAHNMRFSFDYQDQDFETHTANQQISIPIAQVTRLELADVNVGGWGWGSPSVGSSVPFSYNIINSGRVNLINVRTSAEGPFELDQAGRFIGSINAQRTIAFDGVLIPLMGGELQGEFIVTGEDISGEVVELRHPFSLWVDESWGFDDMHDDGWREGGGFYDVHGGGMSMGSGFFHPETGEWTEAGYWDDNGEWVATWEFDWETGEWTQIGGGGFIDFITRPVVWITAAVIVAGAVVAVVIVLVVQNRRKRIDELDSEEIEL